VPAQVQLAHLGSVSGSIDGSESLLFWEQNNMRMSKPVPIAQGLISANVNVNASQAFVERAISPCSILMAAVCENL